MALLEAPAPALPRATNRTGTNSVAIESKRVLFLGVPPAPLDFARLSHRFATAGFAVLTCPPDACHELRLGDGKDSKIVVAPNEVGLFALARALGFEWKAYKGDLAKAMKRPGTERERYSQLGANLVQTLTLVPSVGDGTELAAGLRLFLSTIQEGGTNIPADRAFAAWVAERKPKTA